MYVVFWCYRRSGNRLSHRWYEKHVRKSKATLHAILFQMKQEKSARSFSVNGVACELVRLAINYSHKLKWIAPNWLIEMVIIVSKFHLFQCSSPFPSLDISFVGYFLRWPNRCRSFQNIWRVLQFVCCHFSKWSNSFIFLFTHGIQFTNYRIFFLSMIYYYRICACICINLAIRPFGNRSSATFFARCERTWPCAFCVRFTQFLTTIISMNDYRFANSMTVNIFVWSIHAGQCEQKR